MAYANPETQFRADIVALTPRLRAYAQSLCRDWTLTEDLVQDTLLKAWECRAQYQPGTILRAWMFTILRRRFIDDYRRRWRSCPLDSRVAETTLFAVSDPDKALELDELRRALPGLNPEQREAVLLIGAGELAYEDAARISGANKGTMKSRVSRGRARLHEILAAGDYKRNGRAAGCG